MPTPSLKRSAARREIKSIWLPADHSDERPLPDYPLHLPPLVFFLSLSSFLLGYSSLSFYPFAFRAVSRSLTAPLNTGTCDKGEKRVTSSSYFLLCSGKRNITEIYEIAKRRDLKVARDVLREKAVETRRTRITGNFAAAPFEMSNKFWSRSTKLLRSRSTLLCIRVKTLTSLFELNIQIS